jgi:hypothetical protein
VNGALVCQQNEQPRAETCNGLDDDCDGIVDDGNPGGGLSCNTGRPGICAAGTTACLGGVIVCVQNQQPRPETCNGLDDNCNGIVDDGAESTCPAPPLGARSTCIAGVCGFACLPGFANCDGNPANGCECQQPATCSAGRCCTPADFRPVTAPCCSGISNIITGECL